MDYTNQGKMKSVPLRTWKKIAHQSQRPNEEGQPSSMDRLPDLDITEVSLNKRQCMDFCYSHNKVNFEVVAGSQHHQVQ